MKSEILKSFIDKDRLRTNSDIYTAKSDVYELFSQAEDVPQKVVRFLGPKFQNKIVLDFGCGTGKYIPELSSVCKRLIATDVSETQLAIARAKVKNLANVQLIKTEKDKLPLKDKSVDAIISAWVIGGVHDLQLRGAIIKELKKVLKPEGVIYLVENDVNGDFKSIVEGEEGNRKTERKLHWLNDNNFWEVEKFETYFEFADLNQAQHVFSSIWDSEIAQKIKRPVISLNLAILEYKRNMASDIIE